MTLDVPDLPIHLLKLMAQVPPGKVTTYRSLALALGDGVAARWVGSFLLNHDHKGDCVCHRVVQSTGQVGNFINGNPIEKRHKLEAEGVRFHGDKINLDHYGVSVFATDAPLARLRNLQTELSKQLCPKPPNTLPQVLGGVDVSFTADGRGVAAYVNVDTVTGRLFWSTTISRSVNFPYISSYLAFRELPLLLDVVAKARAHNRLSPVVLVDGTGVLHPRRAGIASHLGILTDWPTVGVTKKRLCGEVNLTGLTLQQARAVFLDEELCGIAVQSKRGAKPIYLSPGHRTDLDYVRSLLPRLFKGHKQPEPLFWADRLSRETARERSKEGSLLG